MHVVPHGTPARAPVGHEREFADLIALLTEQDARLVTVTGPGGVGKSVLARQVGRDMADRFAWDVVHVDCDQGSDAPAAIVEIVAGTRETDRPGTEPWRDPAGPTRRLLVLDRADGAARQIAALVGTQRWPGVVLACAIRPLGVPGERALALGPFGVPDPDGDEDEIASSPAARLFAERAAAADPRFSLTPHLLNPVAAVCAEVGGWPLAIEHAAARVGLLPVDSLAQLLRERPGIAFEPMPRPGRPTSFLPSLRDAFARTWRELSGPEQSVLRAASQFAGPFTAARLAADAALPVPQAGAVLQDLVELGLVRQQPDDRLTLPPPCRQYARWTFGRRFPERPVRTRYLASICAAARSSARLVNAAEDEAAMDVIAEVRAELLPALDQLIAAGDTARALQLAGDAAPCVVQSGQFHDMAGRLDGLLRNPGPTGGPHLAAALVGYADIAFTSPHGADMRDVATDRLWQGVRLTREQGDPLALLHALSVVGGAWPVLRDVEVGARCVQEGIAVARRVGAVHWIARFEAWSGMLAHQTGDITRAITLGTDALTRSRRCADSRARLLAGILLHTVPDPPEGVPGGLPDPVALVTLAEHLQEPRLQSIMLAYLANGALSDRRTADAAYWCARALELSGSLDTWFGAGFAVMFLVRVAVGRQERQQAATLHGMVVHRLDELTANLPPHLAADYHRLAARLRSTMDPDVFDRDVRAGAVLAWPAAIASALAYAYQASTPVPVRPQRTTHAAAGRATGSARGARRPPSVPLSPRESQVLQLIAQGRDAKEIAATLRITPASVSHHTSNILRKLGVSNRTQAAIWAVHHQFAAAADPVDDPGSRPGRPG
jgi:predicted ATPase/DNA-binding CsgD family transcriptional regulator